MGGDEEDPGQVEELGSVGDWRLPPQIRRIPVIAWLFVGLAILDCALAFGRRDSIDDPALSELSVVLGIVAHALPVLLPAVIIARAGGIRLSYSDPLLAGSIAIASSIVLRTVASVIADGTVYGDAIDVIGLVASSGLRVLASGLALAGTVLLARSILRLARGPRHRWAVLTGIAIFALTGAYVGYAAWSAIALLPTYASMFEGPGVGWALDWASRLVGTVAVIGWAYLAWAILTATGDRAQPRIPWLLGVGAMLIRLAELAINLALTAVLWIAPLGADPSPTETLTSVIAVAFAVVATLSSLDDVLFTMAFAAGLGSPRWDEPDASRIGLDPVPRLTASAGRDRQSLPRLEHRLET